MHGLIFNELRYNSEVPSLSDSSRMFNIYIFLIQTVMKKTILNRPYEWFYERFFLFILICNNMFEPNLFIKQWTLVLKSYMFSRECIFMREKMFSLSRCKMSSPSL